MTEDREIPRVLVIDDAAEMRAVLRRTLATDGYRVDDAAAIAEARELDPYSYQAVIVDVRLGRERGDDFVRELVAAHPDMASRCLLITGGDPGDLPEGIPYLVKPFKPDQLRAAVSSLRGVGEAAQPPAARPEPPTPAGPPGETASAGPGASLLALLRMLRARERQDLADRLHDGPVQDLAAALLGLHLLRPEAGAARWPARVGHPAG